MKTKLRLWALNWLTKHLLKAVNANDIITVDSKYNVLYLNKIELTYEETKVLRMEAIEFQKMRLYSVLMNTPANQAQKIMFEKIMHVDPDMYAAKFMLYTIDVQQKILDRLSTIK